MQTAQYQAITLNMQGCVFFNDAQYEKAAEKFKAASNFCLANQSNLLNEYRTNEADCYLVLGDWSRAIGLYDQVLTSDGDCKDARVGKIKALNAQGCALGRDAQYYDAAEKFNTALDLCGDAESVLRNKCSVREAGSYFLLGDYSRAIELYDKVLVQNGDYKAAQIGKAIALNCQGCILWGEKEYQQAAEKFKAASNLCSDDESYLREKYRTNEADCYGELGEHEKAIELYDDVLAKDINYRNAKIGKAIALNSQGCDLWGEGEYQQAAEKFRGASELCPETEVDLQNEYCTNEADCYGELGEYEKAIELYDEILERDGDYKEAKIGKAIALNSQGRALWCEGEYQQAIAKFKAASNFCPETEIDLQNEYCANEADCYGQLGLYKGEMGL